MFEHHVAGSILFIAKIYLQEMLTLELQSLFTNTIFSLSNNVSTANF